MKRAFAIALLLAMTLTLAACGGKAKSADLAAVMAEFKLGDEMMTPGIERFDRHLRHRCGHVKQCAAAMHSSGVNCDEIILIEAVDAAAAGRVKAILDARYQVKLTETKDYLPDEYAIIQQCSVTARGNDVAMIVAPNAAELTAIYDKSVS